jgi:hypothetical protein
VSSGFADIAQRLIDNGYTPIPVVAREKRPAIKNWTGVNYEHCPELLGQLLKDAETLLKVSPSAACEKSVRIRTWVQERCSMPLWIG